MGRHDLSCVRRGDCHLYYVSPSIDSRRRARVASVGTLQGSWTVIAKMVPTITSASGAF
jgi:hypothetical protein